MNTLKSYISESLLDMGNVDNDDVLIEAFLKKNYKIDGSYTIKDGVVDIKGNIEVVNKYITQLTNGLFRFGTVSMSFKCSYCKSLKSLEGAPFETGGGFFCEFCDSLSSLKGAPEKVEINFDCFGCKSLTSLKGAPQKVGGSFYCGNCESLKSLEGVPMEIGGYFDCSNCKSLTSLQGAPKKVKFNFYCNDCGKEFSIEEVKTLCKVNKDIIV